MRKLFTPDNRMHVRETQYRNILNFILGTFVIISMLIATGQLSWQTKVDRHTQQIAIDRSLLQFICDDMRNQDGNRSALHAAEKKIRANVFNRPYFMVLNIYMTQQETNAVVRRQKCAELQKDN